MSFNTSRAIAIDTGSNSTRFETPKPGGLAGGEGGLGAEVDKVANGNNGKQR